MTVRSDITVDWAVSPRIIEVASPSVDVLVQDLIDTLRELEDELENISYKTIVRATGKEALTSDLNVGITCTLLNARLKFEDRTTTFVRCDILGGNLLAVDDAGVPMEAIEFSNFTQIVSDLSPAPTQLRLTEGIFTTASGILQG